MHTTHSHACLQESPLNTLLDTLQSHFGALEDPESVYLNIDVFSVRNDARLYFSSAVSNTNTPFPFSNSTTPTLYLSAALTGRPGIDLP